jgi:hypothetical protein
MVQCEGCLVWGYARLVWGYARPQTYKDARAGCAPSILFFALRLRFLEGVLCHKMIQPFEAVTGC